MCVSSVFGLNWRHVPCNFLLYNGNSRETSDCIYNMDKTAGPQNAGLCYSCVQGVPGWGAQENKTNPEQTNKKKIKQMGH